MKDKIQITNLRIRWEWSIVNVMPERCSSSHFGIMEYWNDGMREEWFGIFPCGQLTIFFLCVPLCNFVAKNKKGKNPSCTFVAKIRIAAKGAFTNTKH